MKEKLILVFKRREQGKLLWHKEIENDSILPTNFVRLFLFFHPKYLSSFDNSLEQEVEEVFTKVESHNILMLKRINKLESSRKYP